MRLDDMRMGLAKPEKSLYSDYNAMREAIERGARDSGLIHNCLMHARHAGLSGEDKYVLLAYHALLSLEEFYSRALQQARLSPGPFILPVDAPPTG
jgi:hypothetical protein